MIDEHVTLYTNDKYFLMIPLETKNRDRAKDRAEEVVNDLLNCISVTKDAQEVQGSPNFLKSIKKIERSLWKILKKTY